MHRWYSGRDFVRVESCRGGWWTLTSTPASSRSPPPRPAVPARFRASPDAQHGWVHWSIDPLPSFVPKVLEDTAATSGPAVRNRPRRAGFGALVVGMLKWKDDRTKKTDGKKVRHARVLMRERGRRRHGLRTRTDRALHGPWSGRDRFPARHPCPPSHRIPR